MKERAFPTVKSLSVTPPRCVCALPTYSSTTAVRSEKAHKCWHCCRSSRIPSPQSRLGSGVGMGFGEAKPTRTAVAGLIKHIYAVTPTDPMQMPDKCPKQELFSHVLTQVVDTNFLPAL